MTPILTPCLVCGRRRHWWGTGYWRHRIDRVQPFPHGASVYPEWPLVAAPICSRLCAQAFVTVLGGRVELSYFERQRRASAPGTSRPRAARAGEART